MKAFISSFEHNQESPGEDINFDMAEELLFSELQQVSDNMGLAFKAQRYKDIWNQLQNEYDDECLDLGT